jgi:hypothetical protein
VNVFVIVLNVDLEPQHFQDTLYLQHLMLPNTSKGLTHVTCLDKCVALWRDSAVRLLRIQDTGCNIRTVILLFQTAYGRLGCYTV